MSRMTDEQVSQELRTNSTLNLARAKFSAARARIEQADLQLSKPSPIEIRRMEFEAVMGIAEALGVKLEAGQ